MVTKFVPINAHSAAKELDVHCLPLFVKMMSEMSYGITQFSRITAASCGAVGFVIGFARVRLTKRYAMTIVKRFLYFVRIKSPRISSPINSEGAEGGDSFSS